MKYITVKLKCLYFSDYNTIFFRQLQLPFLSIIPDPMIHVSQADPPL